MKNIFELLVLVGIIKAGESAITEWTKPAISTATGTGTLSEKINDGMSTTSTTGITIAATSDAGSVTAYTKESQDPATPDLAIDTTTGVVTITSGTVDYSSVTSLEIVVSANDSGGTASTATITLSVNAAPSFSSHSSNPCIADGADADTNLIDLTATDADSDSITYAITSGNTNSDFTITTTGTVQVATGKTLIMATTSSYTLVITATDSSSTPLTATTTVTATVSTTCSAESAISGWTKPVISTAEGTGTLTEKINDGMTTGSTTGIAVKATSGASNTVSYAKVSQNPATPVLAIDSSTGAVTVTSGTVDYTSVISFTIVVSADDGKASTATVTLSVNAAPTFSSHSNNPCIADGAVAGTDLIDLSATDANSDSIKYAIASGNTKFDFAITATGTVEVATGKTLNMTVTNSYTLVITATDDSSTPLTTTATVTATVSTTCSAGGDSGAAALAVTYMTILLALIVSLQ